ncbi:3-phosphoshikimate 1-carboxyvinyltransferase [Flavobacteriaceae bacterium]|jgi:3-phosphoshikimate 1-carboxyvinyltransferase|nr:3-phosphoshikimate 1-carboxyvinyltransferase [Flavobacteriaceae bacterium]MDC0552468.1 3-phosphoshikimate 1-carboxyvinyltransferase [Flavobacteriaceae bacterium]
MSLILKKSNILSGSVLSISGSKSESNRLLILKALYPGITILNISKSDDTNVLVKALSAKSSNVDIHHAGTAMRFLTAFFAISKEKEITLTGSTRMQNRPVKILVDALISVGADIKYLNKTGFPPLLIKGKEFNNNELSLNSNVSSQYISALLLIGSTLKNGLKINLKGEITSKPYIVMTLSLLKQLGILYSFKENIIKINSFNDLRVKKTITVESDWSSASYYYSFVALSPINTDLILNTFKNTSLQGDSILSKIFNEFGVETIFNDNSITIKKTKVSKQTVAFDLISSPDLAQTIAVTCLGLGINCSLTGLKTLLIKETNRLLALQNEIKKLGTDIEITKDSLSFNNPNKINNNVTIDTYEDHRMAMAFAPLSVLANIIINESDVVSKSYPDFWIDLTKIGITINKS